MFAKKYQNPLTYVKVIASQRWDVFLRHSVDLVSVKLSVEAVVMMVVLAAVLLMCFARWQTCE